MSMYKNPKNRNELIKRCFELIEQYAKMESTLEDKFYDVTLSLSCFTTVVAYIRDACLDRYETECIEPSLLESVTQDKDKIKTIKDYIIGLRNGLCHGDVEFINNGEFITTLKINGSFDNYSAKPIYEFEVTQEKNTFKKITKYLLDKFYIEE